MKASEKYVFYDGPLGRFVAEFYKGNAFLHLTMKEWSIDALREVRRCAPGVISALRKIGARHIYAYNDKPDAKWARFMGQFGFREKATRGGWTLMEAIKNA